MSYDAKTPCRFSCVHKQLSYCTVKKSLKRQFFYWWVCAYNTISIYQRWNFDFLLASYVHSWVCDASSKVATQRFQMHWYIRLHQVLGTVQRLTTALYTSMSPIRISHVFAKHSWTRFKNSWGNRHFTTQLWILPPNFCCLRGQNIYQDSDIKPSKPCTENLISHLEPHQQNTQDFSRPSD